MHFKMENGQIKLISLLKSSIILEEIEFLLVSLFFSFLPEYDALAKVIQQHPDRHETLK